LFHIPDVCFQRVKYTLKMISKFILPVKFSFSYSPQKNEEAPVRSLVSLR
jgi:hypothetical protein